MSTLLHEKQQVPLSSEADLLHYFENSAKAHECMRVGLEAEFFAVDRKTGKSLSYEGETGIHSLLKTLASRFQYQPFYEGGAIIALKKDSSMITLEPGGQIELSASPVRNVFEIEQQLAGFFHDLGELKKNFSSIAFLSAGIQPFSRPEEVSWVPKKRYAVMSDYLGKRGRLAHHMMKLTASDQINFDYLSEEHAMASLRTVYALTPIVSAIFANSAFSEGAPNGYLSKRAVIWQETDRDRSGIPPLFLEPGRTFRDYLDYVLDMPMMFIVRHEEWVRMEGLPFRRFIREGYQGHRATLNDFELQLSAAFPEARLKQYLEIRGMDAQAPLLIPAVAAFWKGILYNAEAREKAWELVAGFSLDERLRLMQEVPRFGLKTRVRDYHVFDLAKELVDLSCSSLAKQITADETRNECLFLQRIRKTIIEPGKSPAEQLLENWGGAFGRDPQRLLESLEIG